MMMMMCARAIVNECTYLRPILRGIEQWARRLQRLLPSSARDQWNPHQCQRMNLRQSRSSSWDDERITAGWSSATGTGPKCRLGNPTPRALEGSSGVTSLVTVVGWRPQQSGQIQIWDWPWDFYSSGHPMSARDQSSTRDHGVDHIISTRVNELMSSYYRLNDTERSSGKDQVPNTIDDINSEAFEAAPYTQRLIETRPLSSLLMKNNDLVGEIKTLDGDLQMLVYENYNKFISATDTIRKMQHNVETMEDEMHHMVKSMDEISTLSHGMHERLASKRLAVEKYVNVRRLLQRLEFLFKLPQQLRDAIDTQEYAQAARIYSNSFFILQKYAPDIPSFERIQDEAKEIIAQLCETLRQGLIESSSVKTIDETTKLLIEIQEDPRHILTLFISSHERQLSEMLTKQDFDPFLAHFQSIGATYQELFQSPRGVLSPKEEQQYLAFGTVHWTRYFEAQTSALSSTEIDSEQHMDKLISNCLTFMTEIQSVASYVPEFCITDRAAKVLETVIRTQVDQVFVQVKKRVAKTLQSVQEELLVVADHESALQTQRWIEQISSMLRDESQAQGTKLQVIWGN